MNRRIRAPHLLSMIMLVSYLLRLALLTNEGQFRFVDENRYRRSASAANLAFAGDIGGALNHIIEYERHPGFTAVAFVPALFHRLVYELFPASEVSWSDYWYSRYSDFRFSSLFFVLPSVLAIGMLYRISRRMGACENEALLGAFLFAACNTNFMYSQHFLPYDSSMLIGLVALWLAMRERRSSLAHSMAVGALAFLVFWVYHGYFSFTIMLALLYSLYFASKPSAVLQRAFGFALGAYDFDPSFCL